MSFEYYPDTDSLYIELNPGRKRKPGGTQEVVGRGDRDIVVDVDGDGGPVGIDSFASEIVDLTRLEAKVERERTVIGHQIEARDRRIDRFVYEL